LRPLVRPKIAKERTKTFIQHQSDQCVKIKPNWRKPRGTDGRVHRRLKGQILTPSMGYGSNKETKHTLPSGSRKLLVHNVKELDGPHISQCRDGSRWLCQTHGAKSSPAGQSQHQAAKRLCIPYRC
ncbi:unnamed protein product, partial [Gulo gulo]